MRFSAPAPQMAFGGPLGEASEDALKDHHGVAVTGIEVH
jgi:hypothetical protein